MEIFIVFFILAGVVALIAKDRNRNWFGWFLLSFLITPFWAGVIVLVMKKLPSEAEKLEEKMKIEKRDGLAEKSSMTNVADAIQKLHDLKEKNIITEAEYNSQKSKLLN